MQIWKKTDYIVLSHQFTGSLSATQGDALQSPGFSSGINRLHLSHCWPDQPISACTVAGSLVEMDQRAFRLRVYKDSETLVVAWDQSRLIKSWVLTQKEKPQVYNVYSCELSYTLVSGWSNVKYKQAQRGENELKCIPKDSMRLSLNSSVHTE